VETILTGLTWDHPRGDKVRFIKPVFIGDTIDTIRAHLEKSPKNPSLGMVRVSYEVFRVPGSCSLASTCRL
jgi:acyl dehydratase